MYDERELMRDYERFSRFTKTGFIGRTVIGRPIPYVFLGEMGAKQILIQGSIHAREHITSAFLSMLIDRCLSSRGPKGVGVWIVPMVNIDGVELAVHGLDTVPDPGRRGFLRQVNGGSSDFSLWKANANAVDLNNNFPAMWGLGAGQKCKPAPSGYIGRCPLSEPESKSLARFTRQVKPKVTVSYHCKGEVIYWDFHLCGEQYRRNKCIVKNLSESTGYPAEVAEGSTGGYKDWCIEKLAIPAYTVEVGSDALSHPLPYTELAEIYRRNKNVIEVLRDSL